MAGDIQCAIDYSAGANDYLKLNYVDPDTVEFYLLEKLPWSLAIFQG
jgi:hypothetical protein